MKMKSWVSVPSRGILFPNFYVNISTDQQTVFPSPLGASYFQMATANKTIAIKMLKFPSPLGASYFQIFELWSTFDSDVKEVSVPSRGILFPNCCPPEPAILLAFLTLLRGKSFSCIFFLYLTYTISSKCSIYAVRGKIINYTNTI